MHSGLLWTELHLNTNVQVRKIGNGFGTLKREHFNIVVNPHWFQNGFVSTFLSRCRSGSRYRETNECGPGSMVRLWSSQKVHCFLKNIIHKDWCYRSVSTRLLGKSCFYFYGRRRIHNIESFSGQIRLWGRIQDFILDPQHRKKNVLTWRCFTNLSESVSPHSSQSTFWGGFLFFIWWRAFSWRGSLGTDRFRSLHNLRKSKLYFYKILIF